MGYLKHINRCNNYNAKNKIAFRLDGKRVGQIRLDFLDYFLNSGYFCKKDNSITLKDEFNSFDLRSKALDSFAKKAFNEGITNRYMNEPYGVIDFNNSEVKCLADRSISTLLGLISFGQHLNGYVKDTNGLKMWIGRRSYTKGYEAGKLDHLVAGGLPYGRSLQENLQKECYEEAGMSKDLANSAILTGVVSYKHEYDLGGKKDIIYCYDLELPKNFTPKCTDGEVEEFYLMDIKEVANIVKTSDEFKLNCNLVIIDFLVRHGLLNGEDRDYLKIVHSLRACEGVQ